MGDGFIRSALVLYAPIGVWYLLEPRSAWRTFESWRFANPHALRPSTAGHNVRRIAAIAISIALVVAVRNTTE